MATQRPTSGYIYTLSQDHSFLQVRAPLCIRSAPHVILIQNTSLLLDTTPLNLGNAPLRPKPEHLLILGEDHAVP